MSDEASGKSPRLYRVEQIIEKSNFRMIFLHPFRFLFLVIFSFLPKIYFPSLSLVASRIRWHFSDENWVANSFISILSKENTCNWWNFNLIESYQICDCTTVSHNQRRLIWSDEIQTKKKHQNFLEKQVDN